MSQYMIDNRPAPIDWELKGETARAVQNAKNLIMLRMGELPFGRLRGIDQSLFDLPEVELKARLMAEVDMALMWEPDAEAVSAACRRAENGEVAVECVIEIGIEG